VLAYLLIALGLVVFVQCKNVYPQLLLARLLFSFGGAAASTMVTAILPTMSRDLSLDNIKDHANHSRPEQGFERSVDSRDATQGDEPLRAPSLSISSELTITPVMFQSQSDQATEAENASSPPALDPAAASSKIAGYVGMFAGCGALLALVLFLPLPERFQKRGSAPETSLQYSYYIVAVVALFVSMWCLIGLHGLREDDIKPISLFTHLRDSQTNTKDRGSASLKELWKNFQSAIILGFRRADLGLGYVGGFVARASSVGISLFIPLLVNALFRSSGLCGDGENDDIGGLPDLKKKCSQAYILAAELTGVSQVVALLCAPIFGYGSARLGRRQGPLIFASVAGMLGYILLATRFKIDVDHQKGSAEIFLSMCLIGISQIGAIVCSLGVLSGGVLNRDHDDSPPAILSATSDSRDNNQENQMSSGEGAPLIAKAVTVSSKDLSSLKGSIAGVYSLYGGVGILLLTKLGGLLFDRVSFGAPFFIMAIFNAILLSVCVWVSSRSLFVSSQAH
jgi:MFS family permease